MEVFWGLLSLRFIVAAISVVVLNPIVHLSLILPRRTHLRVACSLFSHAQLNRIITTHQYWWECKNIAPSARNNSILNSSSLCLSAQVPQVKTRACSTKRELHYYIHFKIDMLTGFLCFKGDSCILLCPCRLLPLTIPPQLHFRAFVIFGQLSQFSAGAKGFIIKFILLHRVHKIKLTLRLLHSVHWNIIIPTASKNMFTSFEKIIKNRNIVYTKKFFTLLLP